MGDSESDIIQLVEDLTKSAGDTIGVTALAAVKGTGARGAATLEGSEANMGDYTCQVPVDVIRNAVALTNRERRKSELDKLEKVGPALKDWFVQQDMMDIIKCLTSYATDGATAYASCSETVKDAHLVLNSDRIRFGAATSNNAANDHSACLTTLDATNDKCTRANVEFAKRLIKQCNPKIRPIMIDEFGPSYVAFTGSEAFRDLRSDMATVHEYAMERGKTNPLFTDGDLLVGNIVIKELADDGTGIGIARIADVGDGGTVDVQPMVVLGAQALGFAWADRPHVTTDSRDWGFINGRGLEGIRGIRKLSFDLGQGLKSHGVYIHWFAAQPDA